MNNIKIVGGIAVVALIIAIVGLFQPVSVNYGGTTNYDAISTTAGISNISIATSSLVMTSSSATQGWCTQFNATSTNTLLNLTFMASTTASVQNVFPVGVVPVIKFGACL